MKYRTPPQVDPLIQNEGHIIRSWISIMENLFLTVGAWLSYLFGKRNICVSWKKVWTPMNSRTNDSSQSFKYNFCHSIDNSNLNGWQSTQLSIFMLRNFSACSRNSSRFCQLWRTVLFDFLFLLFIVWFRLRLLSLWNLSSFLHRCWVYFCSKSSAERNCLKRLERCVNCDTDSVIKGL